VKQSRRALEYIP